jgi:hypothetical protein
MKRIITIALIFCIGNISQAQLVVNRDTNTVQLVNGFILSGVSASNIAFAGNPRALGTFSNGNTTNLGLPDGIIMTTGIIDTVPSIGDSVGHFESTDNGSLGCSILDSITGAQTPPGSTTENASVLEFDLVPVGNIMEFQYVFASEEYPEFVCSNFNDVFGFFISGQDPVGGNYQKKNIALIPGTDLPVSINTINNGYAGPNFNSFDCTSLAYSTIYIDNEALQGTSIVFDGFTTVLTAKTSVVPGTTYHLKMAIADVGDGVYDSGIFLKAKSMKSYNSSSGVSEISNDKKRVFPNPTNKEIQMTLEKKSEIQMINIEGKIVKQLFAERGDVSIDISDLPDGMYFIHFISETGVTESKIMKN